MPVSGRAHGARRRAGRGRSGRRIARPWIAEAGLGVGGGEGGGEVEGATIQERLGVEAGCC